MTTDSMTTDAAPQPPATLLAGLRWALSDALTVTQRGYAHLRAQPSQIAAALIFPIIMVVLFAYVFGSAIKLPDGGSYKEFLMPGIYVQTLAMSAVVTATEVADDMAKGIIDRFRSLPIARSAVLVGRAFSDLSLRLLGFTTMVACGVLLAGWRPHRGLGPAVAAFGLLALFTFAMICIGTLIGLIVKSPSMADTATFSWLFPMTFLANTFVPTAGMPGWLRPLADWNPMSATVAATRQLFGNPSPPAVPSAWPLHHPVITSIAWSVLLVAAFLPLAVHRYRRL
jgi:ABC transporter DrrB family efflux protein